MHKYHVLLVMLLIGILLGCDSHRPGTKKQSDSRAEGDLIKEPSNDLASSMSTVPKETIDLKIHWQRNEQAEMSYSGIPRTYSSLSEKKIDGKTFQVIRIFMDLYDKNSHAPERKSFFTCERLFDEDNFDLLYLNIDSQIAFELGFTGSEKSTVFDACNDNKIDDVKFKPGQYSFKIIR